MEWNSIDNDTTYLCQVANDLASRRSAYGVFIGLLEADDNIGPFIIARNDQSRRRKHKVTTGRLLHSRRQRDLLAPCAQRAARASRWKTCGADGMQRVTWLRVRADGLRRAVGGGVGQGY